MRVFVTEQPHAGNLLSELGELEGFDEGANQILEALDQKYCDSNQLPDYLKFTENGELATYRVFLHHPGATPPAERFSFSNENPYVRVCSNNEVDVIASSWNLFLDGSHSAPISCNNQEECAWTNVTTSGLSAASGHCGMWRSSAAMTVPPDLLDWLENFLGEALSEFGNEFDDESILNGTYGDPKSNDIFWAKSGSLSCNNSCHLYCVEQYPTENP